MNPESEVCPIDGLYGLRGAIGPPYIPSRHKRNHNQRNHSVPGAQQQQQQQQKYRRHSNPLSFRSSSTGGGAGGGATEQLARHSWKNPTRGLEVRNRRDTTEVMERANHHQQQQREERDEMRVRRDTAGCVVNYSARRQLLVGCTKTNVIEVRPFCTEDNDEGEKERTRRRRRIIRRTKCDFVCLIDSLHVPRFVVAQRDVVHRGEARWQPARRVHELPAAGAGQCAAGHWGCLSEEPAVADGAPFGGQLDGAR